MYNFFNKKDENNNTIQKEKWSRYFHHYSKVNSKKVEEGKGSSPEPWVIKEWQMSTEC